MVCYPVILAIRRRPWNIASMRIMVAVVAFLLGVGLALKLGNRESEGPPEADLAEGSSGVEIDGSGEPTRAIPEARRAALLRRIAQSDTYLPGTLTESDSVVRRWFDREGEPLRVYYEPTTVGGYTPAMGRVVRDAFGRWQRVGGIPVTFVIVRSPTDADVTVRFINSFQIRRAGQADLVWRSDGRLRRGTLTLALHSYRGQAITTEAVFTVALHEIGHLLGLGHSDQPRDVMYPSTSVHDLTIRDRRTATLLYSLPPGSLKGR